MRKYMLVGLFALLIAGLLLGMDILTMSIDQQRTDSEYNATSTAIAATNVYVGTMIEACPDICRATGNRVSCTRSVAGCGDFYTSTPTPTQFGSTPITSVDATATVIQSNRVAAATVVSACHILATFGANEDCPYGWLARLTGTPTATLAAI